MKTCPQKDLHKNVHNSLIRNSQKLETTYVSINRWKDKQIMVLLSNKEQITII